MNIEKLNEFNFLKDDVENVWQQSLDSEKRRLVHLIEFLKDPYDVWDIMIALLSLNLSMKEMYPIICG